MMSQKSPITPDQLGASVAQHPSGSRPRSLTDLQPASTPPMDVVTDPLAIPGGMAGELAWRDSHRAFRQALKIQLAGAKLYAGLIVAGLGYDGMTGKRDPDYASRPTPVEAVAAYVERATHWIEATTDGLAQQWSAPFPSEDRKPPNPPDASVSAAKNANEALEWSDYHRYELARLLVSTLQRRPALLEEFSPESMATVLTPSPSASERLHARAEPLAAPWVSAGETADLQGAWSRALARVMERAMDHNFNRELPVLLTDARTAIAAAVERHIQAFAETFRSTPVTNASADGIPEPTPEVLRIARMHALGLYSRLYAATLAQVYEESVQTIQAYQARLSQGDEEGADQIAADYEARKLGYDGVPHRFAAMVALHEREQAVALQTLQSLQTSSPSPAATDAPPPAETIEAPLSSRTSPSTRASPANRATTPTQG
ncbi:MAG: hypothetical protein H6972_12260 [Gammaproteobacteria bacterium]|nr:hypothetical protein [Gammaproteobacteria bacterium]